MLQIDKQPAFAGEARAIFLPGPPPRQLQHKVVAQLDVHNAIYVRLAAAIDPADNLVPPDCVRQWLGTQSAIARRSDIVRPQRLRVGHLRSGI
jgi:hypothetical protein